MQASKSKIEPNKNIFKDADFWFSKGHIISTHGVQNNNIEMPNKENYNSVALDYYLSGVKIDPQHLGCVYNVGCCHYQLGKYANASKWFELAMKLDHTHQDSYIGKIMSNLKLGKNE